MSTTTSTPDPAAAVTAAALLDECGRSGEHRRLYVRSVFGISLRDLHAALIGRATKAVRIAGEGLKGIDAGGVLVIPYLVTEAKDAGQNRGSRGFAGQLRDRFAFGAPETRVLIILDTEPVETVMTAAEDAGLLRDLAWDRLCRRAGDVPGPAADLLKAVGKLVGARGVPDADLLTRLTRFASRSWKKVEQAGDALHELGCFLRDPRVGENIAARLETGWRWHERLEGWRGPTFSIELELLGYFKGRTAGVDKILKAINLFGIDYSAFTLDDLGVPEEAPKGPKFKFQRPIKALGGRAWRTRIVGKDLYLAVWIPRGTRRFSVKITGEPAGEPSATVAWTGARAPTACSVDAGQKLVTVPADGTGWRFGTLTLSDDSDAQDVMKIAAYHGEGSWFPVERSMVIDAGARAFRAANDPAALAISPGVARDVSIGELPEDQDDGVIEVTITDRGETHVLPVLVESDEQEPADPTVDSPVHAQLHAARGAEADPGTVSVLLGTEPLVTVGEAQYRLSRQLVSDASALDLEGKILSAPDTWAYRLRKEGKSASLEIDGSLEVVKLHAPAADLERFRSARRAFFAAIRPKGSVLALIEAGRDEALEYCRAYESLIRPRTERAGRYEKDLDRLVRMDSVSDPATGEVYIAPTNPMTVAFYLAFIAAAAKWCDSGGQTTDDDIRSISPRHLLPIMSVAGRWFESGSSDAFLWRRYREQRTGGGNDYEPKYVARRLRFFLEVHPAYANPDQRLVVSMHGPVDGASVNEALRSFYEQDLDAEGRGSRPRIDLRIVSDERSAQRLASQIVPAWEQARDIDRLVRSKVTVSAGAAAAPTFSHISFIFRSATAAAAAPEDMAHRAPTTFVGGLATTTGRAVDANDARQVFSWGTFAGASCGDPGTGDAGQLLQRMMKCSLEMIGGQPDQRIEPNVTRMPTVEVGKAHNESIYESSVWVVHLDRVLGLEAFAPTRSEPARYLIDYDERADVHGPGIDAITATKRIDAYRHAVTQALAEIGSATDEGIKGILRLLNSVYGRWALELLTKSPNQIRERVGTVAALHALAHLDRAFEVTSGFAVVLPVDEIFRVVQVERPTGRSCDDLLYLWVDAEKAPVTVHARLMEVKFRTEGAPDFSEARGELDRTREWLDRVFNGTGPGRLFRARDLAELIRGALSRGQAFGIIGDVERGPVERALAAISSGEFRVSLEFTVDSNRLEGDVVLVEPKSRATAVRAPLPGTGRPYGLVRLGGDWLRALAEGAIPPVPGSWQPPVFGGPPAGGSPPFGGSSPSGGSPPSPSRGTPPATTVPSSPSSGGTAASAAAPARQGPSEAELAEEVRRVARELDGAVLKYGLELEPFLPENAQVGPSVIRFRSRSLGKQALAGVQKYALDLGREVGAAEGVLVDQEPYFITIDVPRTTRDVVRFAEHEHLLDTPSAPGALDFLLGMAPSGAVRVADLARLPHLLVAGATGSGKSVFLRGVILSLIRNRGPEHLQILMVDPKSVDFMPFASLPHLVDRRIVTDPADAVAMLSQTITEEIDRRKPLLQNAGASSALEFYEGGGTLEQLPQMVVIIDEFADLAGSLDSANRSAFMQVVQRYGQLTRAFGIYLVLATQRPSVQVITGEIKANLTARVAMKMQAMQDSMTILGRVGAERLRDKGDLLFDHAGRTERLQGLYCSSADTRVAMARWTRQR